MTDPEFADATYVEPLDVDVLTAHHRAGAARRAAADPRRPDRRSTWPWSSHERGRARAVRRRADRRQRRGDRHRRGPRAVQGGDAARSASTCRRRASPTPSTRRCEVGDEVGLPGHHPARVHPRRRRHRHRRRRRASSRASPPSASTPARSREILIEQSIAGWKEYELEVMRDRADNCVVICSIENLDPMGVHTGDSITVAPGADADRRRVPAHARRRLRLHPPRRRRDRRLERAVRASTRPNGDMVVIEMNPRVSPVERAGVEGDRLPDRQDRRQARRRLHARRDPQRHHQARRRPASSRPSTTSSPRCPRWAFEKFPGTAGVLGTQMQSVGEAMAIGRTFPESLQKALRSLEHGPARASTATRPRRSYDDARRRRARARAPPIATPDRPFQLEAALRRGITVERLARGHPRRPVVPRPDLA